ncbi:MAG: hypothetical protein ACOYN3_03705 [Acidimicrobiia bacterium]
MATASEHFVVECALLPNNLQALTREELELLAADIVGAADAQNMEVSVALHNVPDEAASEVLGLTITLGAPRAQVPVPAVRLIAALQQLVQQSVGSDHWQVERLSVLPVNVYLTQRAERRNASLMAQTVTKHEIPGMPSFDR